VSGARENARSGRASGVPRRRRASSCSRRHRMRWRMKDRVVVRLHGAHQVALGSHGTDDRGRAFRVAFRCLAGVLVVAGEGEREVTLPLGDGVRQDAQGDDLGVGDRERLQGTDVQIPEAEREVVLDRSGVLVYRCLDDVGQITPRLSTSGKAALRARKSSIQAATTGWVLKAVWGVPSPPLLIKHPENLHQHAAFSDRELAADDVRVKGSG